MPLELEFASPLVARSSGWACTFGDPRIVDDFTAVEVALDVRDFHVYAAEWEPGHAAFFVDGKLVKTVGQAPDYPLQLMLSLYEFPGETRERPASDYPKAFVVDDVSGYRRAG